MTEIVSLIINYDRKRYTRNVGRSGKKISILAEENRVCKTREDAGRQLISLIGDYLSQSDWVKLYESTDDSFIKHIMKDWGSHLFPENFKNDQ